MTAISFRVAEMPHVRRFCPMTVSLKELSPQLSPQQLEEFLGAVRTGLPLVLTDDQGRAIPYQISLGDSAGEGALSWIADHLEQSVPHQYSLSWAVDGLPSVHVADQVQDTQSHMKRDVALVQQSDRVDFMVHGEHAMSYVYSSDIAKPYLGPISGPGGTSYTRLDFGTKEHPHHRSVWVAIGDINGVDFLNEPAGKYGRQKHQKFTRLESGPVYAELGANLLWTTYDDQALLDEYRKITVYNSPSTHRLMDIEITLHAKYETIRIGATKEAGPLGIRLTESMKVDEGGTMTNSYGARGEAECWGNPAYWCDYFGPTQGRTLGIAVFDHPLNEHYPTCWHIRNYGLMAPNNFHFCGERVMERGESLTFRYRLFFHEGDTACAEVGARFADYVGMIQTKRS